MGNHQMSWPKYVPHLEAENIYKNGFSHPTKRDCNCCAEWFSLLFDFLSPEYEKATQTLRKIVNDSEPGTFYQPPKVVTLMGSLILWGSDPRNDEDYIAAIMNQCFRKLGYTQYFYYYTRK